MRARGVATVAVLGAVTGCGGTEWRAARPADTRAVAATVRDYLGLRRTCDVLTPEARRDLVAFWIRASPVRPRTCEAAARAFAVFGSAELEAAAIMDFACARGSGDRRTGRVEVADDSARTHVAGSAKAVRLTRSGGRWLIGDLDFSDIPEDAIR